MAKKGSTGTHSRSAVSGRYVKPSYAKSHPTTTVTERTSPKSSGKKK